MSPLVCTQTKAPSCSLYQTLSSSWTKRVELPSETSRAEQSDDWMGRKTDAELFNLIRITTECSIFIESRAFSLVVNSLNIHGRAGSLTVSLDGEAPWHAGCFSHNSLVWPEYATCRQTVSTVALSRGLQADHLIQWAQMSHFSVAAP